MKERRIMEISLILACAFTIGITSAQGLSGAPLAVSNSIIDVGQYSFANVIVSGGVGPYYGQYSFVSSNVAGNNVTNTITVGNSPFGMAFNPAGSLAYVTNEDSNSVSVINVSTDTVVNTITVGNGPVGVAFNPSGTLAYVENYNSGSVSVINTGTNTVINSIIVGSGANFAAFNPQGTLAYISRGGSSGSIASTVNVITVATNTIANTISVSSGLTHIAFNPSGTEIYATQFFAKNVIVINPATNTVVNTISVGSGPDDISFTPSGSTAYVAQFTSGTVNVITISTNSVSNTITLPADKPNVVALNPSGTLGYATETIVSLTEVLNTFANVLVGSINTSTSPSIATLPDAVTFSPSGTSAYIANPSTNTVSVVLPPETPILQLQSGNQLGLGIIATSANTIALTFNGVQYIFNTGANTVYGPLSLYGFAQDSVTGYQGITGLTGTNTLLLANTITINPAPKVTLTPNVSSLTPGQQVTFTISITGGTGPFSIILYNSTGGSQQGNTLTIPSAGGTNTLAITAGQTGTFSFVARADDLGTTSAFAFNSTSSSITVSSGAAASGGSGPPPPPLTLSDDIQGALNSSTPVITADILNGENGALLSILSYYQTQLPASLRIPSQDETRIRFACSFSTGNEVHDFQGDVYGIGSYRSCLDNYTVYGGTSIEPLYNTTLLTVNESSLQSSTTVTSVSTSTALSTSSASTSSTYTSTTVSTAAVQSSSVSTTLNSTTTAVPYGSSSNTVPSTIPTTIVNAISAFINYLTSHI